MDIKELLKLIPIDYEIRLLNTELYYEVKLIFHGRFSGCKITKEIFEESDPLIQNLILHDSIDSLKRAIAD